MFVALFPLAAAYGEVLFTEPIAGAQPWRPEPSFVLRVFGHLPFTDSARRSEGRRPKSLRGGNRGEFAAAVVSVYGDLASM